MKSFFLFATLLSLGAAYPFLFNPSISTSTAQIPFADKEWDYELHEIRPHNVRSVSSSSSSSSWDEPWRLAGRAPRKSVIPVEITLSPTGDKSPQNEHPLARNWQLDSVTAWLEAHGIESARLLDLTESTTTIGFNATIAEMESLLHTEYAIYEHVPSGRIYLGVEAYSLPAALRDDIIRRVEPTVGMFW